MLAKFALALLAAVGAAPALAQLDSLRGTIPGSLHQCEATNLFFFDSSNTRPLSVLFLPSSEVPDSIRSGTVTLDQAQQYSPLLALSDIETPDAQQYNFQLQIEQGAVFEASPPSPLRSSLFAFLPNGEGKALSLTRTVTTPLPGASSCLTNVPTSIAGAGATTAVSAQPTSASSSAEVESSTGMTSSSMATSARASSSGPSGSSSTSTSAPASSSSSAGATGAAGGSSGASSAVLGTIDRAVVLAWTAAVGGAALVGAGLLA
ncbi:hypothetical protein JCM8208_001011 [Rhodotorula glutinis]